MPGRSKRWLAIVLLCSQLGALSLNSVLLAQRAQTAKRTTTTKKTKAQLERERQATLRRIRETSRILEQTQRQKEASLGQLNALKEKLTVQQGVIRNISSELYYIKTDVQQTETQVQKTKQNLEQLKAEYGRLIYAGSKTANSYNRIMFLFAAESFNQFMLRLRYIRQYSEVRQAQAAQIAGTQQRLSQQLNGLKVKQEQQGQLLNTQVAEKNNLVTLKTQQDQVVTKLSKQEQGLRQELADRQRAISRLDNLIADRVREEIARAARVAAAKAAARAAARERAERAISSTPGRTSTEAPARTYSEPSEPAEPVRTDRVTLTPETAVLSSSFADNRGRLLWPVAKGFISQRFGRHNHPVLKNVVVENRGIDIQTGSGEAVRSIFDGKVLTVASVPGMNNIVMIQHGEYFTVYAKLRSVSVSEGQTVKMRQQIGTVYTSSEGTSEVQFQVWRNSSNLNPENWLGRH
ncbi:peptidoglycan DD-metalloendopeptidase family protein [Microvirga sp. STR05]|uniref:Peptidoglycan DD-metalloendopeptidase family protein n=1 Tax=Hymenobacter duratus TaxID=2771356 RepID=A0ABR8JGJ3_9BACT|nr:peptidoglycan DD-metalloendopeptidase family protein [Hymenobacter duratus]MBD2713924.1 peptidoglycan DD-metalloendopeptidase family protein [Hymenobacter duratus]MBR7948826.1 peptidoglycan DD-metalloendopeptidase family protein [Microvirga sp. STR05]